MKNTLYLLAFFSLLLSMLSMNRLKGQQIESTNTKKDEIEVTLAPYFFETDEKTIEIIEKKKHITYDEYIDLTLAYANLFADTSKIDSLIAKSISANNDKACEFWTFLLQEPEKHQITYQYFRTVKSHSNSCGDK